MVISMYKVGDLVTRKSYNNDVVFKIVSITENLYYLKGVNVRLIADSTLDDLEKFEGKLDDDNSFFQVIDHKNLERDEFFYLPGTVLHIDSDKDYLNRCLTFYKKNLIRAYGVYLNEKDLSSSILEQLKKYNPDILVITGHDAYYRKKEERNKYKNTDNFIMGIKEARKYEPSHDKLIIIAGACQSNYEELIKAGANFASSPKRINIHALDPAIIATSMAFSDHNKNIDLLDILNKTKYKTDGMGGIITKGTMYIGFPR